MNLNALLYNHRCDSRFLKVTMKLLYEYVTMLNGLFSNQMRGHIPPNLVVTAARSVFKNLGIGADSAWHPNVYLKKGQASSCEDAKFKLSQRCEQ